VESVFRSHAGELWRAVLATTAGRADIADDVTAEAFSRLLVYDKGVRDPVAWLFRTAFRLAAAELRREALLSPPLQVERGRRDRAAFLSDDLTDALRLLTPAQRSVVFLHYHADLPVSEVAARTGSSVPAVKVRLHRARRALRGRMQTEDVAGE
jgi:RNA polymerase sigma-70 factor (ECF subfamily)